MDTTTVGALVAVILILAKILRDEQLRRYEKKNNQGDSNNNPGATKEITLIKSTVDDVKDIVVRLSAKATDIAAVKEGQINCQSQLKELCESSIKTSLYLEQILGEVRTHNRRVSARDSEG